MTQKAILEGLGLNTRVDILSSLNPKKIANINSEVELISSDKKMGSTFKGIYIGSKQLHGVFPFLPEEPLAFK